MKWCTDGCPACYDNKLARKRQAHPPNLGLFCFGIFYLATIYQLGQTRRFIFKNTTSEVFNYLKNLSFPLSYQASSTLFRLAMFFLTVSSSIKNCKFVTMAKAKKPRAEKYDTKLAINGTFDAVIKASVIPMPKKEDKPKDKPKKK